MNVSKVEDCASKVDINLECIAEEMVKENNLSNIKREMEYAFMNNYEIRNKLIVCYKVFKKYEITECYSIGINLGLKTLKKMLSKNVLNTPQLFDMAKKCLTENISEEDFLTGYDLVKESNLKTEEEKFISKIKSLEEIAGMLDLTSDDLRRAIESLNNIKEVLIKDE